MVKNFVTFFLAALAAGYFMASVPLDVFLRNLASGFLFIVALVVVCFAIYLVFFSPASDRLADAIYKAVTGNERKN